jgi:hypothetical protein
MPETTPKIIIALTRVRGTDNWGRPSWRAMCIAPRHDQGVGDDRRRALGDLFLSLAPDLTLDELTINADYDAEPGEVVVWTPRYKELRVRSNDRRRAVGGLLLLLAKDGRYVKIDRTDI